MAKLPLSTVGSIQNQPTTATSTLNANFSDITTALENTLSRNGASPNSMGSTLDMDSNPIINLPMPVNGTEPVRKIDLDALLTSLLIEGNVIFTGPPGAVVTNASGIISSTSGSNGQVLRSNGPGVAPSFGNFTDLLGGAATGTGLFVLQTSPTLITPALGTPSSGTLTNCTGLPIGAITGLGANVSTFLITPSSINLKNAVTDETGSGALVFANSPALITPSASTNLTIGGAVFPALVLSPTSGATVTGQVLQAGDAVCIYNGSVGTRFAFDLFNAEIYIYSPAATGYLNLHFPGITNGVAASLTFPYANDTLVARTTTDTLTNKSLTSPTLTGVPTTPTATTGTNTTQVASTAFVQQEIAAIAPVGGDLTAIEALSGTGHATRTAANTWALRSIVGTASEITATNGDGVAGNPTLSLPSSLTFTSKTIANGTYTNPSLTNPVLAGSVTPGIQWAPTSGATLNGQIYQQGNTLALATAGVGNRLEIGLGANSGLNAFDTLNITPAYASGSRGINTTHNGVVSGAQAVSSDSYSFNAIFIPQEAARVSGPPQYVNALQVRMISGGSNKVGSRAAGWFETYINAAPKTNGVRTGTINTGGAGYTNGTTLNVQLQRASDNAFVDTYATVTVVGGAVSSVAITDPGTGRTVGQVLTSNGGVIGGSGFQYTVTALTDPGDDVGIVAQAKALANVGGTGLTNSTARGTLFSLAPLVILESGATNWWSLGGGEVDVTISGGASCLHRYGWDMVSSGGIQAQDRDCAISVRGLGLGWKTGIEFGALNTGAGGTPVDPTVGTIIGTDSNTYAAANCIKLDSWSFSGDIFYFNNFRVTGIGVCTATSFNGRKLAQPIVTVLTAGTGTYTTPAGTTYLDVQMVGGGGGGSGSGGAGVGAGGNGGFSNLGGFFQTNGGGGGSGIAPGQGGAAAGGNDNITGSWGQGCDTQVTSPGGSGGSSFFGGQGGGAYQSSAGFGAAANSGSGGGGASANGTANAGGGGGSGGYLRGFVYSPAASYSYTVGAGGAGGAAGAGGFVGGAGGDGRMTIIAYSN